MDEVRRTIDSPEFVPTPEESAEIEAVTAEFERIRASLDALAQRAYKAIVPYLVKKDAADEADALTPENEEDFNETWGAWNLQDIALRVQAMFGPVSREFTGLGAPDWYVEADDPEMRARAAYLAKHRPAASTGSREPVSEVDDGVVIEVENTPGINLKVELSPECSDLHRSFADLTGRVEEATPGLVAMRSEFEELAAKADAEVARLVKAWGCSDPESEYQEEDGVTHLLSRLIGHTACYNAIIHAAIAIQGKDA